MCVVYVDQLVVMSLWRWRETVTDNDGGGTGDLSVLAVRHVRYVTSVHFVSHPFTLYSPAIASSSGSICH